MDSLTVVSASLKNRVVVTKVAVAGLKMLFMASCSVCRALWLKSVCQLALHLASLQSVFIAPGGALLAMGGLFEQAKTKTCQCLCHWLCCL